MSDARLRLMLAAERLFAERGIASVSLREIAACAGQRNTSAVAYHFGSKDALVAAIFEYRMRPINDHRMRLVRAIEVGEVPDLPRSWVEALVLPMAQALVDAVDTEGDSWYLGFVTEGSRYRRTALTALGERETLEGLRLTLGSLHRHLGGLPEPVVADRLELVVGLVSHALAERERLLREPRRELPGGLRLLVADLVDAAVGLLTAEVSPVTVATLDAASGSGAG